MLLAAGLVAVVSQPAAAVGDPVVVLSGPSQIGVGGSATYTIDATGTATGYNLTYTATLPVGTKYQPGSVAPSDAGEPTVVITPPGPLAETITTLIWSNVADLVNGQEVSLSFGVTAEPALIAGDTFQVQAAAYVNSNPTIVPKFTGTPPITPTDFTGSGTATAPVTTVTPLAVNLAGGKSLLRGVHTNTREYTLTVTNDTPATPTTNTITATKATAYVGADLEFLGCGAVDNGPLEFSGAAPLTDTPAVTPCVLPESVATVTDPAGQPAGVYTKVVWNLGVLAVQEVRTIKYRAGVPLFANADTFAGTPTPTSLQQGSNLTNNTGAPTAERNDVDKSVGTYVEVEGIYQGPQAPSPSPPPTVIGRASIAQPIKDLEVTKVVTPGAFSEGGTATYAITARAAEYRQVAGVVLTDDLPDGLCPLSAATNFAPGSAAECAAVVGSDPTAVVNGSMVAPSGSTWFDTVVPDSPATGEFKITFGSLPTIDANQTAVMTFQARMRSTYGSGVPTAASDVFTNTASGTGTSEQWNGATPPGPSDTQSPTSVADSGSVTIGSQPATLVKQVGLAANTDCAAATYGTTNPTFRKGDKACFKIAVTFPAGIQTRNVAVSDFLPENVTYNNDADTSLSIGSYPIDTPTITAGPPASIVWTMGNPVSGAKFVPAGATFVATFSVTIDAGAGSANSQRDVTGNLAKFKYANSNDNPGSLRDKVGFEIAAAPPLSMTRGALTVNTISSAANPTGIAAADVIKFGINVTNDGSAIAGTNIPVEAVNVWEPLLQGLTCTDISAISDAGTCALAGTLGGGLYPNQAVIQWALPDTDTINPGATRAPLTYDLTVPAAIATGSLVIGTAAVTSYQTDTNRATAATHRPLLNVDTTVLPADEDSPDTRASSNFRVATAAITSTQTTSVVESNNNLGTQATIGETVSYAVVVSLSKATVYDPPTGTAFRYATSSGLSLVSATASWSTDGGVTCGGSLPGGITPTVTTGAGGTVVVTTGNFSSTTGTDALCLAIDMQVRDIGGNSQSTSLTGNSTFRSGVGNTLVTPTFWASNTAVVAANSLSANRTLAVVEPNLTLGKTATPTDVVAGTVVTYRLTATNSNGRPPAHDSAVVDCVPDTVTFGAWSTVNSGTVAGPVAGDGTNGCPTGRSKLTWTPANPTLAGDLAAGSVFQEYTATVNANPGAGVTIVNNADLTAQSMAGDVTGERTYTRSASSTLTAATADIAKSVTPGVASVGDVVTYTLTTTVPADVALFDAAFIDTLPTSRLTAGSVTLTGVTCAPAVDCSGGSGSITPTPLSNATSGANTLVGWLLPDLDASASERTITLTYTVPVTDDALNNAVGNINEPATIKWFQVDPGTAPTSAGDNFPATSLPALANLAIQVPSLAISNSTPPTTVAPGEEITFTVATSNAAGGTVSSAFGVATKVVLPAGLEFVSASGGATESGGTITWPAISSLAAGATDSQTYVVRLAASGTVGSGSLATTASVTQYESILASAGGHTYSPTTITSIDQVTPVFPRVTAVASTPAGATLNGAGSEPFVWRDTLTNESTTTAYVVGGVNTLPAGWTYQAGSALVSVAGGTAVQVEPSISGGVLTWTNLAATLAPTETVVITFTGVSPSAAVSVNTTYTNSVDPLVEDATGASASGASAYAGPTATADATAQVADIELVATPTLRDVGPGQSGSLYAFNVTNLTTTNAAQGPVTLTINVDPDLVSPTASGTGWTCETAGTVVTCTNAASLAASGTLPTVTVRAGIPVSGTSGTTYTATGLVEAVTHDPVQGNNTSSVDATVAPAAVPLTTAGVINTPQGVDVDVPAGATVSFVVAPPTSQGIYTISGNTITFTPDPSFVGTADPAVYLITDSLGQTAQSTYTPTVAAQLLDLTSIDLTDVVQQQTVDLTWGGVVELVGGSTATEVTVAGEGTYVLNQGNGKITFTPVTGYVGAPTPVIYTVIYSATSQPTATYQPEVVSILPFPLTSKGYQDLRQSQTAPIPPGGNVWLLDELDDQVTNVTTPEGTYALDQATGVITFTPEPGFVGDPTPVAYRGIYSFGSTADSTYSPKVLPLPVPLTSTGVEGQKQTVTVDFPSGYTIELVGGTDPNKVVIPGQGTYVLNPNTGVITFTPVPGYVGPVTPVTYALTDPFSDRVTSTYDPTVTRAAPLVQQPRNCVVAKKIKGGKNTTVIGKNCITNAGQSVRSSVRCKASKPSTRGDLRICNIKRSNNGKIRVKTSAIFRGKVIVKLSAPATEDYAAYRKKIVYRIKPRK